MRIGRFKIDGYPDARLFPLYVCHYIGDQWEIVWLGKIRIERNV